MGIKVEYGTWDIRGTRVSVDFIALKEPGEWDLGRALELVNRLDMMIHVEDGDGGVETLTLRDQVDNALTKFERDLGYTAPELIHERVAELRSQLLYLVGVRADEVVTPEARITV